MTVAEDLHGLLLLVDAKEVAMQLVGKAPRDGTATYVVNAPRHPMHGYRFRVFRDHGRWDFIQDVQSPSGVVICQYGDGVLDSYEPRGDW